MPVCAAVVVHAGVCGSSSGQATLCQRLRGCGVVCFNTVPQLRFELPGVMHGVSLLLLCIAYVLDNTINTFHLG